MKKVFLLAAAILTGNLLWAQSAPAIQWQKTYGGSDYDFAYAIQQTNDGGYIIAGYTSSNDGDVSGNPGAADYWLVKTDSMGNLQWQKTYGGSSDDYATAIQQTNDGGYIIAGYTSSNDGDVSGNHGWSDYWLVKTDSIGNLQWQKTYGGSNDDGAYAIQLTNDGGYIIAGLTYSNDGDVSGNHGGHDCWLVKTDSLGNLQWQKTYGGSNDDGAFAIQLTNDGGYIIAGYTGSNDGDVSGNHGQTDYWLVKTDSMGNLQWQKTYGGSNNDKAYAIQLTNDGGYIIAGFNYSNDGDVSGNHGWSDYWLVKTDSIGNLQWQKTYGGSNVDFATAIQQTNDGGYIIAGYTGSNDGDVSGNHGNVDYWLVKTDSLGNLQWQKTYGGSNNDEAFAIQLTNDGGYIIAGYSESNDGDVSGNHGSGDFWLVKLAPDNITGITSPSISYAAVYPNPANNTLNIKSVSPLKSLQLSDMQGKILLKQTLNTTQTTLDISDFSRGIYFMELTDQYNNRQSIKIIRE